MYVTAALGGAAARARLWRRRIAGPALLSAVVGGAAAFGAFFALCSSPCRRGSASATSGWLACAARFSAGSAIARCSPGFVLSFIVAGVPAVVLLAMRKVQRRTQIPFGPFLAAGTVIAMLFGAPIIQAWASV